MAENSDQQVEFAFDGPLRSIFLKHWQRDKQQARLSLKFRLYYLLRPYIPIALRQKLQRSRNQTLDPKRDWYIPKEFLHDVVTALNAVPDRESVIHPWPDDFSFAACLTHDVETADGQKRIQKIVAMEEKLGLRSAWYFIPHKYRLDLGLIDDLRSRGHEVGVHGYNHDGRLFTSRSIFNYRVKYINQAGKDLKSSGFRAPMVHRNLEWMQSLDFDYDSSCFDVDPFQAMPGGVGGCWPFSVGKLVELPYTLPQDHTLLVSLGERSPRIWIEKLALIKRMSGMAMLITHPDYLDVDERISIYQQFCEHLVEQRGFWLALPSEIATWWRARLLSCLSREIDQELISGPANQRGRIANLRDLIDLSNFDSD